MQALNRHAAHQLFFKSTFLQFVSDQNRSDKLVVYESPSSACLCGRNRTASSPQAVVTTYGSDPAQEKHLVVQMHCTLRVPVLPAVRTAWITSRAVGRSVGCSLKQLPISAAILSGHSCGHLPRVHPASVAVAGESYTILRSLGTLCNGGYCLCGAREPISTDRNLFQTVRTVSRTITKQNCLMHA